MSSFWVSFIGLAIGVSILTSRADWAKMLAFVPLGALVPAAVATATGCGAGFFLHPFAAGSCQIGETEPFRVFAFYFVFALVAVLIASIVLKAGRMVLARGKAAE